MFDLCEDTIDAVILTKEILKHLTGQIFQSWIYFRVGYKIRNFYSNTDFPSVFIRYGTFQENQ